MLIATLLAELFRALGALKLLQADARADHDAGLPDAAVAALPSPMPKTKQTRGRKAKQRPGFTATATSADE